jgi:hypothetical protein
VFAAVAAACRKPLPDQLRAVRAAYLGFGSTDMANMGQLPAASVLSKWLKSTKKAMAAAAAQYSTGGVSAAQHSRRCCYGAAAETFAMPCHHNRHTYIGIT